MDGDDLGLLLLRQADRSFAPPPAAAASVWRGVESALLVGSMAPTPLAPTPSTSAPITASLAPQKVAIALSWKVGLGLGVAGLVGAAAFFAAPAQAPPSPADPPATAVSAPFSVPSSFVVSSAGEGAILAAGAPTSQPAASGPALSVAIPATPLPTHASPVPPLPPSDAEKLLEARRAIRSGDSARALVLLGAVSPNGSMAEERDILTIEALVPSNKVKAERLATQFLQQHPHSAYRGRAEAVLAR